MVNFILFAVINPITVLFQFGVVTMFLLWVVLEVGRQLLQADPLTGVKNVSAGPAR